MLPAVLHILGGTPVEPGEWPDAVVLFGEDGDLCTGTLIDPEWVLTAGHCARLVRAVVGTNDHASGGRTVAITEQITHPDHRDRFDVSLVRLAEPVLDVAVRPLVQGCRADFLQDGVKVVLAGFGRTDREASVDTSLLHAVEVPVVDADCADLARGCRPLVGPGGEFVAGGDGLDSCAGDSGGPAYLAITDVPWLAGVVSRSASPFETPCGDGGIYTRVDAIVPWIRATTGLSLPDPTCDGLNRPPGPAIPEPVVMEQGATADLTPPFLDPDPDDRHTFTVLTPPTRGRLDGLVYTADTFQLGRQELVVRITDDGSPARSALTTVVVEVQPAGLGAPAPTGGCATGPRPAFTGWRRR
jgi:hypothetical protein